MPKINKRKATDITVDQSIAGESSILSNTPSQTSSSSISVSQSSTQLTGVQRAYEVIDIKTTYPRANGCLDPPQRRYIYEDTDQMVGRRIYVLPLDSVNS